MEPDPAPCCCKADRRPTGCRLGAKDGRAVPFKLDPAAGRATLGAVEVGGAMAGRPDILVLFPIATAGFADIDDAGALREAPPTGGLELSCLTGCFVGDCVC